MGLALTTGGWAASRQGGRSGAGVGAQTTRIEHVSRVRGAGGACRLAHPTLIPPTDGYGARARGGGSTASFSFPTGRQGRLCGDYGGLLPVEVVPLGVRREGGGGGTGVPIRRPTGGTRVRRGRERALSTVPCAGRCAFHRHPRSGTDATRNGFGLVTSACRDTTGRRRGRGTYGLAAVWRRPRSPHTAAPHPPPPPHHSWTTADRVEWTAPPVADRGGVWNAPPTH